MMGYSGTSLAVPLLFSTTSMVLNLAWSATSFLLPTTSTPSRRSRTSSNYSKQRETASNRPSTISPPAQMELRLSTCCTSCGTNVSLEVPKWISDSVGAAKNGNQCDGSCQLGRNHGTSAGEIRGVVVEGAVSLAHSVRTSPVSLNSLAALGRCELKLRCADPPGHLRCFQSILRILDLPRRSILASSTGCSRCWRDRHGIGRD